MNEQLRLFRSIPELLLERAARQPDRLAIRSAADDFDNPPTLTYQQLDQRVRACAAHLQACCGPSDRAIVLLPSGVDFVAAFLGCLYAGIIAVPAFPPEQRQKGHLKRLEGILRDAAPRVILTSSNLADAFEAPDAGSLRPILIRVDALDPLACDAWRMPGRDADQVALLQYTSGSTSSPKGVKVTHGNLIANEIAVRDAFGIEDDDSFVSWLPLYHDMGLIGSLLQPLFSGIPLTLLSPQQFLERPVRWLQAIARYKATISGGPDFAYRLCTDRISAASLEGVDLQSWRLAFCGAEPVRIDTAQKFIGRFEPHGFRAKSFYPCFGLAEATLFVTGGLKGSGVKIATIDATALSRGRVEASAGGKVIVGCGHAQGRHNVIVMDATGAQPRETGDVGEIWVSGPSISQGYWNNAAATAESFVAHQDRLYLRTGDLGFCRDGELFVTGRLKDLIIIRGQNIYPNDVERIVESEVDALRAGRIAAFAVDAGSGEGIGVAAEVSRSVQKAVGGAALARAISAALAQTIHEPASLVLLLNPGGLPRTSSGKLQRAQCVSAWRGGGLDVFAAYDAAQIAAAAPVVATGVSSGDEPDGALEAAVALIWAEALNAPRVGRRDNFFELGGTSLSAAAMVAQIQQKLNLEAANLAALFAHPTLAGFTERLKAPSADHAPRSGKMRLCNGVDLSDPHVIAYGSTPSQTRESAPAIFGLWSATVLRPLALRLAENGVPFFALRLLDDELADVSKLSEIEDIARLYVTLLKHAQPSGPYVLLGFCTTAAIAFEMARQLGEEAALVILVDTVAPRFWRLSANRTNVLRASSWLRRRLWLLRKLCSAPASGRRSLLLQMMPLRGSTQGRIRVRQSGGRNLLYGYLWQATQRYLPQSNPRPVLVIRGETQVQGFGVDPTLGWSDHSSGEIGAALARGDHEDMFQPPNVEALAQAIIKRMVQTSTVRQPAGRSK